MVTLDGAMQAPGGPGEDPSDGFKYEKKHLAMTRLRQHLH